MFATQKIYNDNYPRRVIEKEWLYDIFVVQNLKWKDIYKLHNICPSLLANRIKHFGFTRAKRPAWCKGTKGVMKPNSGSFKKGQKGELCPRWKGGIADINRVIRGSFEYKSWRKAVYERDRWTCIWCGYKGSKINADHIKSFATYPELRFDVNNGRTLCIECHKTTPSFKRRLS